jgi:hypothetical protein
VILDCTCWASFWSAKLRPQTLDSPSHKWKYGRAERYSMPKYSSWGDDQATREDVIESSCGTFRG